MVFNALMIQHDNDNKYEFNYDMNDMVWGVGLKSLRNVSWADACDF